MDYSFHIRIPLADAHSKHICIILVIDSQNLRKLHGWPSGSERDENITQKRKSNKPLIKRWNFSRMSILKAQNSISWTRAITNEIMLFCVQNIKNMKKVLLLSSKVSVKANNKSILTPFKPIMLCSQTHGKVMQLHSVQKHVPRKCF